MMGADTKEKEIILRYCVFPVYFETSNAMQMMKN